ncbi:4'-phosphopantetheinyl transferase family protein [Klugiella xanthotipulae]|uniref:Phosphopantetheinyl transferase n=1 Tax=Klugiella xanthotipulae TaxID=244735 RepID=A0A543HHA4_9MICO|nr:4'-phosphopantetheinyl transferase superfamily protein [Klugiella xanthotipulae]TQM57712.1 phosphopantetheinyl transferase [Klugiella xanthotipulae]
MDITAQTRTAWVRWVDPGQPVRPFGTRDFRLLDIAERARWRRIPRRIDRERFTTGRATLKRLVSEILDVPASTVAVVEQWFGDRRGRPQLWVGGRPSELSMSITHSASRVGVAVSDARCGIDVQDVAAVVPVLHSGFAFAPGELQAIRTLDGSPEAQATLWWTRKEAALKALGVGLLHPPHLLDARSEESLRATVPWGGEDPVTDNPDDIVPESPAGFGWAKEWDTLRIRDLDPGSPGYRASLALVGVPEGALIELREVAAPVLELV